MIDRILVQRADFSLADEYAASLPGRTQARLSLCRQGARLQSGEQVKGWPRTLPRHDRESADEHCGRGPQPLAPAECTLIHRIGELLLGDQIVLVVVSSAHREAAFEACHFIMDFLKTRAPFWKKS